MEISWQSILGICFFSIVVIFLFLQWRSNRTYKPTVNDIHNIIQATINGTIDIETFDEFSSVYIAYREDLDAIRNMYNKIITNMERLDKDASTDNVVPLNDVGKRELRELINHLNELQA